MADNFKADGRQGAVAGGDRTDRCRHASAVDAHRQRKAGPDLFPGIHGGGGADPAPSKGNARAENTRRCLAAAPCFPPTSSRPPVPPSSVSMSPIPTSHRKRWARAIPNFVEEYKKAFGEAPISGYHANAYDAAILAIKAIEKVAKTDAAGNLYIGKKALRDAVFATQVRRHQRTDRLRSLWGMLANSTPRCWSTPRPIPRPSRSARTRRRSGRSESCARLPPAGRCSRPPCPSQRGRYYPLGPAHRGRAGRRQRHDRILDQRPLYRRAVVRSRDVWPDHRQHLRADRARLHDGLWRVADDQLRPWRDRHERSLRRLFRRHGVRPLGVSRQRDRCRRWPRSSQWRY